jgi:phage terminase large subunit-like protein
VILVVPALDDRLWPTLGPLVCDWIEEHLIFGPGDLRGEPAKLDDEKRALLYRMYEIYPKGHPEEGRRRFKRVALSLRKGVAKTELMAWIAAAELHPDAPVRFAGWTRRGQPLGQGVRDPYIPMVAYTEEQSEELAYGTLRVVLAEGPLHGDFDIGLERIMRKRGDGKAVALASAPNARDGARTTFNCFDETHRMTLPNLKRAHQVMLANIPKRKEADAWSLEITTAPEPGGGSVAEDTYLYAKAVADGHIKDARLCYFHRQASDAHDLSTAEGVRAAVIEASGPAAAWSDIDGILDLWRDPTTDRSYFERVWLNRMVRSSDRAFDAARWRELVRPDYQIPRRALVTLGFDGARYHDSTALVATEVATGFQQLVACWEHPGHGETWEVPEDEVDAAVTDAFERWQVWRMYADPPYWQIWVSEWAGRYGEKQVVKWYTNRYKQTAYSLLAFQEAIQAGAVSHDGSEPLARHVGNAYRRPLHTLDDQGRPLWVIQKERSDSPHKIDAAMAAVLSWRARIDALASGVQAGGEPRVTVL